jgi:hypothetical protein
LYITAVILIDYFERNHLHRVSKLETLPCKTPIPRTLCIHSVPITPGPACDFQLPRTNSSLIHLLSRRDTNRTSLRV